MMLTNRHANSLNAAELPWLGSLVGDPGRHLGDAREIADGVVAGRNPGVSEMEHVERAGAPGAPGLGVHPSQQPGIAFRVEHDHHVAAADVLGNQHLGQPGLADACRAQHQRVTGPLAEVHPDCLFPGLDGMQDRVAACPGRKGVLAAAPAKQPGQPAEPGPRLPVDLPAPDPAVQGTRLHVAADLRAQGIAQALRVQRCPAKAPAKKQLARADRKPARCQPPGSNPAKPAPVPEHPPGLAGTPGREGRPAHTPHRGPRQAASSGPTERARPRRRPWRPQAPTTAPPPGAAAPRRDAGSLLDPAGGDQHRVVHQAQGARETRAGGRA